MLAEYFCFTIACNSVEHMQPKKYSCGGVLTVTPNDLRHYTYEQMFFKNNTKYD